MFRSRCLSLVLFLASGWLVTESRADDLAFPTNWYSASAPQPHPYLPGYNFSGPLYPQSPRYFQPGYGYVVPMAPFSPSLQVYSQNYAYGAIAYGLPYGSVFGTDLATSASSLFGPSGISQAGPDTMMLMHRAWYFPGSPANDRPFLLGW